MRTQNEYIILVLSALTLLLTAIIVWLYKKYEKLYFKRNTPAVPVNDIRTPYVNGIVAMQGCEVIELISEQTLPLRSHAPQDVIIQSLKNKAGISLINEMDKIGALETFIEGARPDRERKVHFVIKTAVSNDS